MAQTPIMEALGLGPDRVWAFILYCGMNNKQDRTEKKGINISYLYVVYSLQSTDKTHWQCRTKRNRMLECKVPTENYHTDSLI